MFVFPILWTSFHQIGSVNKALLLWYWQQLRKCFLGICNTFLFFKIERWKFQHLFKSDFNSIRQPKERMKITIFWMSWNFVRFHEILFQTDAESFSFLSWKTKKFYSKNNPYLKTVNPLYCSVIFFHQSQFYSYFFYLSRLESKVSRILCPGLTALFYHLPRQEHQIFGVTNIISSCSQELLD